MVLEVHRDTARLEGTPCCATLLATHLLPYTFVTERASSSLKRRVLRALGLTVEPGPHTAFSRSACDCDLAEHVRFEVFAAIVVFDQCAERVDGGVLGAEVICLVDLKRCHGTPNTC